jgi:6-pyruvoyltetrahydropterin/6-carboxytetrahydropterin synthase
MRVELVKTFAFEAAHRLPRLPEAHKCFRLHGHSFRVDVSVAGEVDPRLGWLIDYAEMTEAFEPLRRELDHACLNEIPGLENATSENLARFIWDRLAARLPGLLASVTVHETCAARCVYRGDTVA